MLRTDSGIVFVCEINGRCHKPPLFILRILRCHSCLFIVVLNAIDRSTAIFPRLANLLSPGSQRLSMQEKKSLFKRNTTVEMQRAIHRSETVWYSEIFLADISYYQEIHVLKHGWSIIHHIHYGIVYNQERKHCHYSRCMDFSQLRSNNGL